MHALQSRPRSVLGKRMMMTPTFCISVTCCVGALRPQPWHDG